VNSYHFTQLIILFKNSNSYSVFISLQLCIIITHMHKLWTSILP